MLPHCPSRWGLGPPLDFRRTGPRGQTLWPRHRAASALSTLEGPPPGRVPPASEPAWTWRLLIKQRTRCRRTPESLQMKARGSGGARRGGGQGCQGSSPDRAVAEVGGPRRREEPGGFSKSLLGAPPGESRQRPWGSRPDGPKLRSQPVAPGPTPEPHFPLALASLSPSPSCHPSPSLSSPPPQLPLPSGRPHPPGPFLPP